MKISISSAVYLFILAFSFTYCQSQSESSAPDTPDRVVGGPCEGCEAVHEYGNRILSSVDTLPGFSENDPKIKISGTVYNKDGKTPVPNVIIYVYHTNREGIYETQGSETGWGTRHGHYRGWIKTDENGRYSFYTFRPAAYPTGTEPEHIHYTVKEPGLNEYYIESAFFDDDPMLSKEERKSLRQRGGSGIVKLENLNGLLIGERDIILGMNIPDYE